MSFLFQHFFSVFMKFGVNQMYVKIIAGHYNPKITNSCLLSLVILSELSNHPDLAETHTGF